MTKKLQGVLQNFVLLEIKATTGRDIGGEGSFANLYGIFLQNIKRNLHVILCMSPVGTSFRNSLRFEDSLVDHQI